MNKKKFKLLSINNKLKQNFIYKKKIIVKDLLLNIVIGYYSTEKIKKQYVKFNIELDYKDQNDHSDKDIKSIVDYGRIIKTVKNLTKNKHYNFLESLADDIFDTAFSVISKNHFESLSALVISPN